MSEILSFKGFRKKYQGIRTDEMIAYELYLLLKTKDFSDVIDRLLELEK